MLDAIIGRLPSEAHESLGLTMQNLHVDPGPGGALIRLLPRPAPFDGNALFLDVAALRQVAGLLAAAADVIEVADTAEAWQTEKPVAATGCPA